MGRGCGVRVELGVVVVRVGLEERVVELGVEFVVA